MLKLLELPVIERAADLIQDLKDVGVHLQCTVGGLGFPEIGLVEIGLLQLVVLPARWQRIRPGRLKLIAAPTAGVVELDSQLVVFGRDVGDQEALTAVEHDQV